MIFTLSVFLTFGIFFNGCAFLSSRSRLDWEVGHYTRETAGSIHRNDAPKWCRLPKGCMSQWWRVSTIERGYLSIELRSIVDNLPVDNLILNIYRNGRKVERHGARQRKHIFFEQKDLCELEVQNIGEPRLLNYFIRCSFHGLNDSRYGATLFPISADEGTRYISGSLNRNQGDPVDWLLFTTSDFGTLSLDLSPDTENIRLNILVSEHSFDVLRKDHVECHLPFKCIIHPLSQVYIELSLQDFTNSETYTIHANAERTSDSLYVLGTDEQPVNVVFHDGNKSPKILIVMVSGVPCVFKANARVSFLIHDSPIQDTKPRRCDLDSCFVPSRTAPYFVEVRPDTSTVDQCEVWWDFVKEREIRILVPDPNIESRVEKEITRKVRDVWKSVADTLKDKARGEKVIEFAIDLYEKAIGSMEKDSRSDCICAFEIACLYKDMGKINHAIRYFEQAKLHCLKAYLYLGDLTENCQYYFNGKEGARQIEDRRLESEFQTRIETRGCE